MVLVGRLAPEFPAHTKAVQVQQVKENFRLADYRGKYVVLFFWPLDFTFVCPTEIHAFQDKAAEFEKLGAQLIGVSTDSHFSHLAWLDTPKAKGGIQGVQYPIVADFTKEIAAAYDVLVRDGGDAGVALRGLFLIDKEGRVQHQVVNNLPLGRSVEEALRMLEALKHVEAHGEVCPADWKPGAKAMKADEKGKVAYFAN